MSKDKKYNAKRQIKTVSFLKEDHKEILTLANSLHDFSGYVREVMKNTHKTAVFTRQVVEALENEYHCITYGAESYNNHFTVNGLDFRFYRIEENIFLVLGVEYFLVKDVDEAVMKVKDLINE